MTDRCSSVRTPFHPTMVATVPTQECTYHQNILGGGGTDTYTLLRQIRIMMSDRGTEASGCNVFFEHVLDAPM